MTAVDSIISNVIERAPVYENIVHDYRAQLYGKGHLDMKKRNFTFRYIPKMFRTKKGVKEYLIESYSELHYTSPKIYDQKVLATYGTTYGRKFQASMLEYFNINIYASTLLYNRLLSPVAKNARKYYKYHVDSVMYNNDGIDYRIRFIPRTISCYVLFSTWISKNKSKAMSIFFHPFKLISILKGTQITSYSYRCC